MRFAIPGDWAIVPISRNSCRDVCERRRVLGRAVVDDLIARDVFDLWAHRLRLRKATCNMIVVRYADDIVVGLERETAARRFWDTMTRR